jgi:hypothetical protein
MSTELPAKKEQVADAKKTKKRARVCWVLDTQYVDREYTPVAQAIDIGEIN